MNSAPGFEQPSLFPEYAPVYEQPSLFPENDPDIEKLQEYVDRRISSPAFDMLAAVDSSETLPTDTQERLEALRHFADKHWNLRIGLNGETLTREQLDKRGSKYKPNSPEGEAILAAGEVLGSMNGTVPENPDFKVVAVLGGSNDANRLRLLWALMHTRPEMVVMLCSGRKLSEDEKNKIDYAKAAGAQDEYELGCAAVEQCVLQENEPREKILIGETTIHQANGDTWRYCLYRQTVNGVNREIMVVGSPELLNNEVGKPTAPTTHSNIKWLASGMDLKPGDRIGIVTTQVFAPEQEAAAKSELLPLGLDAEVFGYGPDFAHIVRTPDQIIQDANATVSELVKAQGKIKAHKRAEAT